MSTWTKKDKVACVAIFVIAVLIFVAFLSTITLAFFMDTRTMNKTLTVPGLTFEVTGESGNTSYSIALNIDYPNSIMAPTSAFGNTPLDTFGVRNTSTSTGLSMFLMVKVDNTQPNYVFPRTRQNWVKGSEVGYWYYCGVVAPGNWVEFNDTWQTGNFPNSLMGTTVSLTLTAYAVQAVPTTGSVTAVESAVGDLMDDSTSPWYYAPQVFKDFVTSSNYR